MWQYKIVDTDIIIKIYVVFDKNYDLWYFLWKTTNKLKIEKNKFLKPSSLSISTVLRKKNSPKCDLSLSLVKKQTRKSILFNELLSDICLNAIIYNLMLSSRSFCFIINTFILFLKILENDYRLLYITRCPVTLGF